MRFAIFEERPYHNFYPLTLTRPLWELKSGCFSFRERSELLIRKNFGPDAEIFYFTRDCFDAVYSASHPEMKINDYSLFKKGGEVFFIGGAVYLADEIFEMGNGESVSDNGEVVAARIDISPRERMPQSIAEFLLESETSPAAISPKCARYIWDIVAFNGDAIKSDFEIISHKNACKKNVTVVGDPLLVYIEENVEIDPFVVIDSTKGPVLISEGCRINPFTRIEGPCFVGKDTILLGAKIREGCTIGEMCRVGGEVEDSIIHAYSNKYHDGFLGHAYVGEWVNLGAMTSNSDLKNNYSTVKVVLPSGRTETGQKKVGCFIGDYVKTSIGTLINTGATISTGAMLVHDGKLTPPHVPPFNWFMKGEIQKRDWCSDFIFSAREMMSRRGVELDRAREEFLNKLYAEFCCDGKGF